MKKYWQSAGLYVLIFVIILAALAFSGKGLMQPAEETKVYNYSDLISELDQDNVKTIEVTKSKEVSNYGTATAVLDDGTTSDENKKGAVGDIGFVIAEKKIDDELLVIAGDNFFTYSLRDYVDYYREKDHRDQQTRHSPYLSEYPSLQ